MASIADYLKKNGVIDTGARYSNGTATITYNPSTKTYTSTDKIAGTTTTTKKNTSSGSSSSSKTTKTTTTSPAVQEYLAQNGYVDTGARYSNGTAGGTYNPSTGVTTTYDTIAGTKNTYTPNSSTYANMASSQRANQQDYLNSLINAGGGDAEWAKTELAALNSVNNGGYYGVAASTPTQSTNANSIDNLLVANGINPSALGSYSNYNTTGNVYDEAQKRAEEQYAYQQEQIKAANEASVKSGVERLQNQLKTTNQGFDDAGRQAYIRSVQNEYALPNQLAAMGYTGGLSETEAARARANYQNTMADIEQQRVNAQNEAYAAINELRNTADQRTAEQNLALAQEYADKIQQLQLQSAQYNEQQKEKDFSNWSDTAKYLYYNDYSAEIQKLQADNADGHNDQKIALLMQYRQEKLNEIADKEANEATAQSKAQQQQIENALALWKEFGVATQDIADILGVPVGAKTSSYQNVISQISSRLKSSSGSSGSGGGNSTKGNQTYAQTLSGINEIIKNQDENLNYNDKAAAYLTSSGQSVTNMALIAKQVGLRPEAIVHSMVSTGKYTSKQVEQFIEEYVPARDADYANKLKEYAYAGRENELE